ncbi:hypothetical protein FE773_04930 [Caminibacter mediatlanticus TB-2]|uniref:Glycosyltransferase RgtA/B/C/D-like domain-containing protein n=1 Tax=Caminibacter mediatlanticus TB-2 TaxID=391592 RepID=A0ABX5V8D9_9BACT|nr:glycosyltransferase family 39 protein [Caminibacter mediatlanticus]QCT94543.1 hypothetical protein FE773_04930 [Caminibacter mediatlanticus TB-2]
MRLILFFLLYYLFLFWYGVNFLSFSIVEVESIEKFPLLNLILNVSFYLFGVNDFALRIPSLIISVFNVMLFFNIAKYYFKKENDIFFTTIIFALIPGFIISSLIINKSIYLLFFTLLFVFLYKKNRFFSYLLLMAGVFLDKSLIVLYLGIVFYSIYKKDNLLLVLSLILLTFNANFFNYKIGGKPKGYFLNVLGTYFLIFSPLVFVYFLFSLYKGFFLKKDIIFFIAITSFLVSILFSFRQRIKIDDYAPYVLPYTIYMVKIFLKSYRIRLPRFRNSYKLLFVILFSSLIIFDIALFLNSYTPARKLTNSFYFIKPLTKKLKNKNIDFVYCNNTKLCKSLYFYGIKKGSIYYLKYNKSSLKVSIFHKKNKILEIDVSKLNTL